MSIKITIKHILSIFFIIKNVYILSKRVFNIQKKLYIYQISYKHFYVIGFTYLFICGLWLITTENKIIQKPIISIPKYSLFIDQNLQSAIDGANNYSYHSSKKNSPLQLPLEDQEIDTLQYINTKIDKTNNQIEKKIIIGKGDNLSLIFNKLDLSSKDVFNIIKTPVFGMRLKNIQPNEIMKFIFDQNNQLILLNYYPNKTTEISYSLLHNQQFKAQKRILKTQSRTSFIEETIYNSFTIDSQKSGLPYKIITQLHTIFGWDIDFSQDIRKGDSFKILYNEIYLDNEKLRNGNILSAIFTNKGKTYTAIRYTDKTGHSGYYNLNGQNIEKAFLRTPVKSSHVSSKFNPQRLHPIFKTKRPHLGVDYNANYGTPIQASGDGKISFAGWKTGYGNVVFIQHPKNIVTVYAHQKNIASNIYKGKKVKKGQTIGHVGSTGWATGPHLHYEFRINGIHKNPETVELPASRPIAGKDMLAFVKLSNSYLSTIAKYQNEYAVTRKQNDTVNTKL